MLPVINLNPKQKLFAKLLSDPIKKFIMAFGSSRAGKTYYEIRFIAIRALRYANSDHLVCRYSKANAKATVWLKPMMEIFKPMEKLALCKINDTKGIITFTNGSRIILGGLEPSRIDSVLAMEYATILVTEAPENKYSTIETLFTRLNSTAKDDTGKMIPLKFMIDLNPTTKRNWTYMLWVRGIDPLDNKPKENFNEFASIQFKVEDNQKNLSPTYIRTLKSLSEAKRRRFYDGEFGSFEGLVYDFNEDEHVVDDFEIPKHWKRGRAIDFGFVHPFVCLWSAQDPVNETIYYYREWVKSNMIVSDHAIKIKELSQGETYVHTVADHDAEDRATLHASGIQTTRANKKVDLGLDRCMDLMDYKNGKRTRMKVFRSLNNFINGFYSYRWKDASKKEREVIKEDDDEMDAFRYDFMEWFPVQGTLQAEAM